METKKCPRCGRELPLSEFYVNKSKPDGHGTYCKECQKKMSAEYYELEKVKKANAEHEQKQASVKEEQKPKVIEVVKEKTLKDFQPRELIKRLYDLGYRIENNQLICIVKQVVNLRDVING